MLLLLLVYLRIPYFYGNKEHDFVSVHLLWTDNNLTFTERVSSQYIMCVVSSIYGQYTKYMSLATCHVWVL